MDIAAILRSKYNLKKETDMVALVEEAVLVASLVVPERLKKHRSRIVKLLFDDNPGGSDLLFSDDELFDDDDDEDGGLGSKITTNVSPLPVNKTEIKIPKKGAPVDDLSAASPRCGGGRDVHGGVTVGCKRKSFSGNGRLNSKVVQAPTCGVKQRLLSKMKRRKLVQYNPTWIR